MICTCDCGQRVEDETESYVCLRSKCRKITCVECNKNDLAWTFGVCPDCLEEYLVQMRDRLAKLTMAVKEIAVASHDPHVASLARSALKGLQS